MLETQLNIFDSVVIGVFALSCLVAFFRGFIREILSLGAWVAAGIITVYFYPHSSEYMKQYIKNPEMAAVSGAIGTYICALFGISIINSIIIRYVKTGAEVGLLDNLLGLTFGAARGAFIVSLGFLILTFVMDEDHYPEWLKEAKTLQYAEFGAEILSKAAPEYVKELSTMKDKIQETAEEKMKEKLEEEAKKAGTPADDGKGYNFDQRLQLDRLFELQQNEKEKLERPKP
jgi:membrane protein required for colicin V production